MTCITFSFRDTSYFFHVYTENTSDASWLVLYRIECSGFIFPDVFKLQAAQVGINLVEKHVIL